MPWTDKPGGSGQNGDGRGPWGQPPNSGPNGGNDNRGGRRPSDRPAPDLEELLRSGRDRFRRAGRGGGGARGGGVPPEMGLPSPRMFAFGALALVLVWLATGFYSVSAGAIGVVTTFGQYSGLTGPGLNWHLPWPIQSREIVQVAQDRTVSIGGTRSGGKTSMLTSDLNIVDVDMTVNYKVRNDGVSAPGELPNAAKFLFNVENPERLVKAAAESALREVVGANEFEPIISRGRNIVNNDTARILQEILDSYDSGIEVIRVNFGQADPPEDVIPAQRDVIDANSEAERRVNEANAYYNRQVPRAQGEARQTVLDSEAYAARVVAEARGSASRFNDIYAEYRQAPDVTRQRLYLETMENVLSDMNKVVIDDNGSGGAFPYLNLNELARDARERPRRTPPASSNTGGNQ